MIYLTEQCNRRTVHGWKQHAVCSWSTRDTRSHYGAVCLSHTDLSVEAIAWLTAPKGIRHPFIWKHGSVLEQYQAVMFYVHSLQLDFFKSLCFGLRGSAGNGLRSTSLCIFLCVCSQQSSIYSIQIYISIFFVCIYSLLFLHWPIRTNGFIFFHKGCYYNGGLLPHLFAWLAQNSLTGLSSLLLFSYYSSNCCNWSTVIL